MSLSAIILLLFILGVFIAMARQKFGPEIGMPVLALIALIIAGPANAGHALKMGFEEFGHIALLFTAVAMGAHGLQESNFLKSVGMNAGKAVGRSALAFSLPLRIGVPAVCLMLTWFLAALFHNTTAILVATQITIVVCLKFQVAPTPVLCGSLVASNLGGFSSRWGDSPNIIEAQIWSLSHGDFRQILFVNLGCLALLIAVVASRLSPANLRPAELEVIVRGFDKERRHDAISLGLAASSFFGLFLVIVLPIAWPRFELQFAAMGILAMALAGHAFGRKGAHQNPFGVLGLETLSTLVSVFVLAAVLGSEHLGLTKVLKCWLEDSGAPVWAIIGISYIGTLLTEAASWANAAAPMVHSIDPTHRSAWALGAGICAGSSALVTSATAGILLMKQTEKFEQGRITFASYLKFGLGFSGVMVAYYTVVLTLLYRN